MKFSASAFIFTRDLRTVDNIGLIEACANSDIVIPCFVADPKICNRDSFRLKFLQECINEINEDFVSKRSVLQVFSGDYTTTLRKISEQKKIDAVFVNHDNTPFAKKRQDQITQYCKQNKIEFHQFTDHLMYDPNLVKTLQGRPYTIFSQFFRSAIQIPVSRPRKDKLTNFYSEKISDHTIDSDFENQSGGRKNALKILQSITDHSDYQNKRDYPGIEGTTKLSAHNRFGTISIRELYHIIADSLGPGHTLISEIHWHEFFSHVLYHFPSVVKKSFRRQDISWRHNQTHFEAWKQGKTGFPIIDAGMRQLNSSGFMHNRVRMIVASFLTKDLHIDWKKGERYFAEKLVDYDLAVNNGNWQWAASTGCDAQPWFRIFNPWLQQKKFDPDCVYIKKWIPEIISLDSNQIHRLEKESFGLDYPRPIVDHSKEFKIAKQMFG